MVKKIAGIFLAIILVTLLSLANGAIAAGPPPPPETNITVTDSVSPVDDQDIPFGDVGENTASDATVTIINDGNIDLEIFDIAQDNPLEEPFSILDDNCSNQFITPNANCTFTVRFEPTTTGIWNDSFDISSDDDPVTVNVSGTSDNDPPPPPQLVYPSNAQTCSRTTETFIWGKSTDPDGDDVTYDLYVCEDSNFTTGCITKENIASLGNVINKDIYYAGSSMGLLLFGIVLAGGIRDKRKIALLLVMIIIVAILSVSCGSSSSEENNGCNLPDIPNHDQGSEVAQEVSGLKGGTKYYWKVFADDGNGGVSESEERSFVTQ